MTAPALRNARRLIRRALRRIMRPTGHFRRGSGMEMAWVCGTSMSDWRPSTPARRRFFLNTEQAGAAVSRFCCLAAALMRYLRRAEFELSPREIELVIGYCVLSIVSQEPPD